MTVEMIILKFEINGEERVDLDWNGYNWHYRFLTTKAVDQFAFYRFATTSFKL